MQLAAPEALDLKSEPAHVLKHYGLDAARRPGPKKSRRGGDVSPSPKSAWPPAACSSAACVSSKSGVATTTASRAATGIRTKMCSATTARSPSAWRMVPRRSSRISSSAGSSTTRSSSGRPSSAACPRRRAARGATTTPTCSPTGSAAAVSRAASYARRKRPLGLQAARPKKADAGVRHPRHDPAPARHRPHRLFFRHNGIDRRLTDVHGHVIKPLVA
jgi:hypothetical protein